MNKKPKLINISQMNLINHITDDNLQSIKENASILNDSVIELSKKDGKYEKHILSDDRLNFMIKSIKYEGFDK